MLENLDYRVGTNTGACGRKYRWVQTGGGVKSQGTAKGTRQVCTCAGGST